MHVVGLTIIENRSDVHKNDKTAILNARLAPGGLTLKVHFKCEKFEY